MTQHTTSIRYRGVLLECSYDYEAATPATRTEAPTSEYVGVHRVCTKSGDDVTGLLNMGQLIELREKVRKSHHEQAEDARTEARIRDLEEV